LLATTTKVAIEETDDQRETFKLQLNLPSTIGDGNTGAIYLVRVLVLAYLVIKTMFVILLSLRVLVIFKLELVNEEQYWHQQPFQQRHSVVVTLVGYLRASSAKHDGRLVVTFK